ncbi:hypothetical protein GQR58_008280 [Nymphon striatum]|nr:hypothetical protein GQR58_008280 [Nymphon striatum]
MVKWFTLATVYHPLAKMEWEPGLKSCLYSQSNQFNAMLVNACHQLKYFTTVNQFDESTVHSQSNQPSRQITQIHRTLRSDNNWTPPSFSTAANQASSLSPSILLDKLLPLLLAKLLISKHPAGQTSSSAEGSSPATGLCSATSNFVDIAQQLDILREKTQESDHNLRSMQQEQEKFVIQYQESSKLAVTCNLYSTTFNIATLCLYDNHPLRDGVIKTVNIFLRLILPEGVDHIKQLIGGAHLFGSSF